jgi:hypothetical protein
MIKINFMTSKGNVNRLAQNWHDSKDHRNIRHLYF